MIRHRLSLVALANRAGAITQKPVAILNAGRNTWGSRGSRGHDLKGKFQQTLI